jgi:hypothetical protein
MLDKETSQTRHYWVAKDPSARFACSGQAAPMVRLAWILHETKSVSLRMTWLRFYKLFTPI